MLLCRILAGIRSPSMGFTLSSADENVQMRVNDGRPIQIHLQGSGDKSKVVPVQLNRGNNSITFTSKDAKSVAIDRLKLSQ